jgi:hypothetical protein
MRSLVVETEKVMECEDLNRDRKERAAVAKVAAAKNKATRILKCEASEQRLGAAVYG